MLLQVGNALQEKRFVAEGNVIEQNKMLVNLAHITNVWHDTQPEFPGHQADRKKF